MEDSGIDSDPKSLLGNVDDVLFPTEYSAFFSATLCQTSLKKAEYSVQKLRLGHASDSSTSSNNNNLPVVPKSHVRQLHRRLEQRIQEAKKLQKERKPVTGGSLIPIQRLSIPSKLHSPLRGARGAPEHVPLVDWDTGDTDSEEDVSFFPLPPRAKGKQALTDTFSIEEFEVSPDEDDLDLLPPQPVRRPLACCQCVIL